MVSDKVNYRTTGPMTATTKQPTTGRSNGGGLRIGEMETNAILGHGLGSFLKESMMERSDKYGYFIENNHGTVAMGQHNNLKSTYKNEETYDYSYVNTPYSMKLLLQEIESFGIKPTVYTDDKKEFDDEYENIVIDENLKDVC